MPATDVSLYLVSVARICMCLDAGRTTLQGQTKEKYSNEHDIKYQSKTETHCLIKTDTYSAGQCCLCLFVRSGSWLSVSWFGVFVSATQATWIPRLRLHKQNQTPMPSRCLWGRSLEIWMRLISEKCLKNMDQFFRWMCFVTKILDRAKVLMSLWSVWNSVLRSM